MQKNKNVLWVIFGAFIVLFYYRRWLGMQPIIGGDWPYRWPEVLNQLARTPTAWDNTMGGGLGGITPSYFLVFYNALSAFISVNFHVPWVIVYKILWFFGPILAMYLGGVQLSRLLFPKMPIWVWVLTGILFTTNTYMLMITGGGQMGVVAAVSVIPWVLNFFIRFLQNKFGSIHMWLLGMIFGVQLSLDPRIAFITIFPLGVLFLSHARKSRYPYIDVAGGFISFFVAVLLNMYWILPVIMLRANPLGELGSAYTSIDALRFFSFADFSHAYSLLHPNWPENVFGLTHFLQPEFLLLPILAFGSLFWVKQYPVITALSIIGLIGVFLAKGTKEPFGEIFVFLFDRVPGFVLFRDPTKFYTLIILSYGILIPVTVSLLSKRLDNLKKFPYILPVVFILFWVISLRQANVGTLSGTFERRLVASEYVQLKEFLSHEDGFFRTLWVPRQHRFAFSSPLQTPVESDPLFHATDSATVLKVFNSSNVQDRLASLGFRYIIVGSDPYSEIFLEDRQYSKAKRSDMIASLKTIPWLTTVRNDSIAIFKTPEHKDLFWLDTGIPVDWKKQSDDEYQLTVPSGGILTMSQTYHPGWKAKAGSETISSRKDLYGLNSFVIPQGVDRVTVEFTPKGFFEIGKYVSFITLLIVSWVSIALLVRGRKLPYNG